MAEYSLSLRVLDLVAVLKIIIASTSSVKKLVDSRVISVISEIPRLAAWRFQETAIFASSDPFKVLPDLLWKREDCWVFLVQVCQKRGEKATLLFLRLCTTGDALEAKPWLIQLRCVLTQGRVKTGKMK